MRNACSIAIASVFVLCSCLADSAFAGSRKKFSGSAQKARVTLAYAMQTPQVKATCFPGKLRAVLNHIARYTGQRLVITSGHRRGGRPRSYHRKCLAADIRVPGVSVRTIVAAARSAPDIGGIGTYCNGIVHVDVGPKRRWRHC